MITLKKCQVCEKIKSVAEFSVVTSNKDGYCGKCKACVAIASRIYYKTLPGVISHIYNGEKESSKNRGHPPPAYTKKELNDWLHKQDISKIYLRWKKSNYLKDLCPSVDRINSMAPYTFNNIRLVTWKENNDAAYKERKSCKRVTKQCRSVNQLDAAGQILATFKSISMAGRETGIERVNINATCAGRANMAGGYYWAYT